MGLLLSLLSSDGQSFPALCSACTCWPSYCSSSLHAQLGRLAIQVPGRLLSGLCGQTVLLPLLQVPYVQLQQEGPAIDMNGATLRTAGAVYARPGLLLQPTPVRTPTLHPQPHLQPSYHTPFLRHPLMPFSITLRCCAPWRTSSIARHDVYSKSALPLSC